MSERSYGFETLAIHAGAEPDPTTGARAVPIYQTTSYVFDDVDHAAALFNLQKFGNIYTRLTNPTVSVLEGRIAALEGGTAACCTASGHAAQFLTFLNLLRPGDNVVVELQALWRLDHADDPHLPAVRLAGAVRRPARARRTSPQRSTTRPGRCSSRAPPTPTASSPTSRRSPAVAHAHGRAAGRRQHPAHAPTCASRCKWGADIVVHSMTKYLGGQGNSVGGAIVEGGRFDWANGKFPLMTEPTEAYHGLRFFETFGNFALTVRNKAIGLRDMGPALSPFNAFLILQGIETLPLRMDRHVANADKVAAWLATNPHVELGLLPPPAAEPHAAAREVLPARPGLGVHHRRQGRLRDGRAAGRQLPAAQPRRQHRRHPLADHPPGLDHPPPARRGAAGGGRRRAGSGAAVDRHRDGRRHHRRPGPGAGESGGVGISGGSEPDLGHGIRPRREHTAPIAVDRRRPDGIAAETVGQFPVGGPPDGGGRRDGRDQSRVGSGGDRCLVEGGDPQRGSGATQGGSHCVVSTGRVRAGLWPRAIWSAMKAAGTPVAVGQRQLQHAPSPPLEEAQAFSWRMNF